MLKQTIILASQSPNRRELFSKLQVPFTVVAANVDESQLLGEPAIKMVERLAKLKAETVSLQYPDALVIGADEVAVLKNQPVGKPLTFDRAKQQLQAASGNTISFYTGLCLLNGKNQQIQTAVEKYQLVFRELTDQQIEYYLNKEQPFECAGSIKVESLGVALCKAFIGDDPAGLIGLPLIRLVAMLQNEGIDVLSL